MSAPVNLAYSRRNRSATPNPHVLDKPERAESGIDRQSSPITYAALAAMLMAGSGKVDRLGPGDRWIKTCILQKKPKARPVYASVAR